MSSPKRVLKDSEAIHDPFRKVVGGAIEQVVLVMFNLLAILFVSPFTWQVLVVEILVLVSSIYVFSKIIKGKSKRSRATRWWCVTVIMLVTIFFGPFVVNPKPIYTARTAATNPFASKLSLIKVQGKVTGSVLCLSEFDVARKHIARWLHRFLPNSFISLEAEDYQNNRYYRLPVLSGFTFDAKEPGETSWPRSIYFPFISYSRGITAGLPEKGKLSFALDDDAANGLRFTFLSPSAVSVMNFEFTQYPDTVPWDAVQVQQYDEALVVSYVATLDRALRFFATFKTDEAMCLLENLSINVPTSNLEGARLATLQYLLTREFFTGNIGQLQALPNLHRAYELFTISTSESRYSARDPLTIWIGRTLLDGYLDWEWTFRFYDRIDRLKDLGQYDRTRKTHFNLLRSEIETTPTENLIVQVNQDKYAPAELHLVRSVMHHKLMWAIMNLLSQKNKHATFFFEPGRN